MSEKGEFSFGLDPLYPPTPPKKTFFFFSIFSPCSSSGSDIYYNDVMWLMLQWANLPSLLKAAAMYLQYVGLAITNATEIR